MTLSVKANILDINPYIGGDAALPNQTKVLRLASNENPLGPSPKSMNAYRNYDHQLHRYPDGSALKLRQAIGNFFNLNYQHIVCSAGSEELISLLAQAFAGPGDEIIHSQYGFLMYAIAAKTVGATIISAPEKNFKSDVDAIIKLITKKTKIIFLANPNNPTGTYLSINDIEKLYAHIPDHTLLVLDAAYAEYIDQNDFNAGEFLVNKNKNVIMLRTFSKIFGLASLRLGWCYAHPFVIDILNRVRNPFNVSAPAQVAGLAALDDEEHIIRSRNHNKKWLAWTTTELKEIGINIIPSIGNFILLCFSPIDNYKGPTALGIEKANKLHSYLNSHGILPRKVGAYGLDDCLRLTIGTEEEAKFTIDTIRQYTQNGV
ncbi:MAG: histidinol-phosphate transaminase [Alphaproteobacteria bacterium]|nr:histidinol-phosphate transaminase [Alphaproteobacteria bacterium]